MQRAWSFEEDVAASLASVLPCVNSPVTASASQNMTWVACPSVATCDPSNRMPEPIPSLQLGSLDSSCDVVDNQHLTAHSTYIPLPPDAACIACDSEPALAMPLVSNAATSSTGLSDDLFAPSMEVPTISSSHHNVGPSGTATSNENGQSTHLVTDASSMLWATAGQSVQMWRY